MKPVIAVFLLTVLMGSAVFGQVEIRFDPDPLRVAQTHTLTVKGAKEGQLYVIIRDQARSFKYERSFDIATDEATFKLFLGRRCDPVIDRDIPIERIFLVDLDFYVEIKVSLKDGPSVTREWKIGPRAGEAHAEIGRLCGTGFTITVTHPASDRTCEPDYLDAELTFITSGGILKRIPIRLHETSGASGQFSTTLSFELNANVREGTIQRKVGDQPIDEKPIPPTFDAFRVELFVGSQKLAEGWLAERIELPVPQDNLVIREKTAGDDKQVAAFIGKLINDVLGSEWRLYISFSTRYERGLRLFVFATRNDCFGLAEAIIEIIPDVDIKVLDSMRRPAHTLKLTETYSVTVQHALDHGKVLIAGLGPSGKIVERRPGGTFSPKDLFGEASDVEWIAVVYYDRITPPVFQFYPVSNPE